MDKKITETKNSPPKLKSVADGGGAFGNTEDEVNANVKAILKACGTDDMDLMNMLVNQLGMIMPSCFTKNENRMNGALAMLSGIAPKNELEGMLAVQMVSSHILAMETAKRSMIEGQMNDSVTENINRCNKLMKTFVLQVEALSKLRGDSKTVTVKHVTVADGGKAIIGDVHHKGNTNGKN